MPVEDSCRKMIKLRENPYLLLIYNLIGGEKMRESCVKSYSGSVCFSEKTKKRRGAVYSKESFMCIITMYLEQCQFIILCPIDSIDYLNILMVPLFFLTSKFYFSDDLSPKSDDKTQSDCMFSFIFQKFWSLFQFQIFC